MIFIKRKIRIFSLWLNMKTDEWVVPTHIWAAINRKEDVTEELEKHESMFPKDPLFVKVHVFIKRVNVLGR